MYEVNAYSMHQNIYQIKNIEGAKAIYTLEKLEDNSGSSLEND